MRMMFTTLVCLLSFICAAEEAISHEEIGHVHTKVDGKPHEITIDIRIECPMSAELEDFVKSIPDAGEYSSSSFEEWKSSFIDNMRQLIRLVESEKIGNSFWSVKTDVDLSQETQQSKGDLSLVSEGIWIKILQGEDVCLFAEDLAVISNQVFKEYPYLWGIEDDAQFYLDRYGHSKEVKLILSYDDTNLIGYVIGLPLKEYSLQFQQPFKDQNLDIDTFFYVGEFALLPPYRGRGIAKQMLRKLERSVEQESPYSRICLAHIEESQLSRSPPIGYSSSAYLWSDLGYKKQDSLSFSLEWPNVGDAYSSPHTLVYWTKDLERDRSSKKDIDR